MRNSVSCQGVNAVDRVLVDAGIVLEQDNILAIFNVSVRCPCQEIIGRKCLCG